MRKNLLCFVVVIGLVFSFSLALAQNSSDKSVSDSSAKATGSVSDTIKSKLEAQKVRLQEVRKGIEEKVKNKAEEVKKKLEATKAEIVKRHADKIIKRYDAALSRFDNLLNRTGARMEKLTQDGKDVSKSRPFFDDAKSKIEIARAKFIEMKASLELVADSETPKTEFDNAKTKVEELKTALLEAQSALSDTISSIKGSSEK